MREIKIDNQLNPMALKKLCAEMVELALHDLSFNPDDKLKQCLEKHYEVQSFLKIRSREKNPFVEEYRDMLQKCNIKPIEIRRAKEDSYNQESARKWINNGSAEFLSFRYCIAECGISPIFIKNTINEIKEGKSWRDDIKVKR